MSFASKPVLYSATALTISELRTLDLAQYELDETQEKEYEEIQERLSHGQIFSHTSDDTEYHFKLAQIYSAPYVIYGIGNYDLLHEDILAMVGPRKISEYGREVMQSAFESIRGYDLVTVSGLADGVDTLCHELSISNNIPTIAILGGGLRHFLRGTKRSIIKKIIDVGGLVLSEFKIDMSPANYTFPQRNRIIAGLGDVLFLPEAGKKSGSLITVDFAHKMKKPIYGVPNDIYTQNSAGLLEAMQEGTVTPVYNINIMLDEYFTQVSGLTIDGSIPEDEGEIELSEVVLLLQKNPDGLSLKELVDQSGLSTSEVMSQLSMAEVMGQVKSRGDVWRVG